MSKAMKQTIIAFAIIICLLFIALTIISIIQYTKYKIVDGIAVCVEFVDRCVLSFTYKDKNNEEQKYVSPIAFDEIQRSGVFNVQVAYTLTKDGQPDDFFIIGSPFHVFLGTKTMLLIYIILSFVSLLICLSFIPGLYQKQKTLQVSNKK
jgi:hypothetical protein